ncbi:MAG TPA: peptidylprolyl isomerase [Anaerolineae bacterium]|nr:peptidylprolyl isomerase [Anaerolineae bacterium]HOR01347.1 peptidylprolyl isomerase [Anaerolineae bacterium]HPL28000.1 peptidylprolyl isomerase [Anaerolineae bacterium]
MKANIILAALALLFVASGCSATQPGETPQQPEATGAPAAAAALVNGRAVPLALYEAQVKAALAAFTGQPGLDPDSAGAQTALRQQVLEMLIDRALIDQAAERLGIAVDEAQVSAEVERVRNQAQGSFADWLAANGFSEETFRAQTRSDLVGAAVRDAVTKDVPTTAEQVHLRQIVVESEAEARGLLEQLGPGQAAFEALAQQHSADPDTRDSGGDLGFVPRGVLLLSVEQAAFALEPGQVSDPIQSPLGWHILKLEARDPAREVPSQMLYAVRQEAFMHWLDDERTKATIERLVE